MNLFANIKNFAADESGAVTVDWVVLTAAIVGLGIAVVASVRGGTTAIGNAIEQTLETGAGTLAADGLNFGSSSGSGGGGGN